MNFDKLNELVETSFDEELAEESNNLDSLLNEVEEKCFTMFSLESIVDDEFKGEFYASRPFKSVFEDDDGKEKVNYRMLCLVINNDEEEYLRFNINLKSLDGVQRNVSFKSTLAKTIRSLFKCLGVKWSSSDNSLDAIHLVDIMDVVEGTVFTVTGKVAGSFNGRPYYFCDFVDYERDEEDFVEQM